MGASKVENQKNGQADYSRFIAQRSSWIYKFKRRQVATFSENSKLESSSSAINGHNRIGDTSSVIRKLDDGATNDHVDRRGNTALHFAVRFGYIRIVQVKILPQILNQDA